MVKCRQELGGTLGKNPPGAAKKQEKAKVAPKEK
jgi:hypothetical protein